MAIHVPLFLDRSDQRIELVQWLEKSAVPNAPTGALGTAAVTLWTAVEEHISGRLLEHFHILEHEEGRPFSEQRAEYDQWTAWYKLERFPRVLTGDRWTLDDSSDEVAALKALVNLRNDLVHSDPWGGEVVLEPLEDQRADIASLEVSFEHRSEADGRLVVTYTAQTYDSEGNPGQVYRGSFVGEDPWKTTDREFLREGVEAFKALLRQSRQGPAGPADDWYNWEFDEGPVFKRVR